MYYTVCDIGTESSCVSLFILDKVQFLPAQHRIKINTGLEWTWGTSTSRKCTT